MTDYSPYSSYSFYPPKNLGALGDGGAIVTSQPEIAGRRRMLRDGGRRGDQLCRVPAVNSRLDEIHSCYLRALLPNLSAWNARRRRLAELYRDHLQGLRSLRLPGWDHDSVHHLFVVRVHHRDRVRAALLESGVQTGVHYPIALHQQPGLLPGSSWRTRPAEAELAAQEVLSLPIGPHVTERDVLQIASILRSACQ